MAKLRKIYATTATTLIALSVILGGCSKETEHDEDVITYTLTITSSPVGGGTVTHTPAKTSYAANDTVTVTATAADGYTFTGWTGATTSADTTAKIVINGNKTVTANFALKNTSPTDSTYTLTANAIPANGGTVTKSPDKATYVSGDTVTVTATAAEGYTFTRWAGTSTSTNDTVKIIMDGNKTITANFLQGNTVPSTDTYTLTVNVMPNNGGNVIISPSKSAYAIGDSVTLTAIAAQNYLFDRWTAVSIAQTIPNPRIETITVVIDGDMVILVDFIPLQYISTYTLTANVAPVNGGTITLSPSKSVYNQRETVFATATAAEGYTFLGWTGEIPEYATTTITIEMNANIKITANFQQNNNITGPATYKKVTIGTQSWMAENLNITTPSGSYCYGNNADSCSKYGRLYNWETAMAICPSGWKLPDSTDWNILITFAGGTNMANTKLKATSDWKHNNGTDEYGFSALPGGLRTEYDGYTEATTMGCWWSATEKDDKRAIIVYTNDGSAVNNSLMFPYEKIMGMSVRCIER